MLLPVDGLAGTIFFTPEVVSLCLRHLAIGLGLGFMGGNLRFALVKPVGFPGIQLARSHALADAFLLDDLPLVDPWRCQRIFWRRGLGKGGAAQSKNGGGDQDLNFHDEALSWGLMKGLCP